MKKIIFSLTALIIFATGLGNAHAHSEKNGCFYQSNLSEKTLNPVVLLVISLSGSKSDVTITGTGWVGEDEKIHTARHLFSYPYSKITAYNNHGQKVGLFNLDAPEKKNPEDTIENFINSDTATLSVSEDMGLDDDDIGITPSGTKEKIKKLGFLTENHAEYMNGFVLDAGTLPVLPGASGAPILNKNGEVVGTVSATDLNSNRKDESYDLYDIPGVFQNSPGGFVGEYDYSDKSFIASNASNMNVEPITNEELTIPAMPLEKCVVYTGHSVQGFEEKNSYKLETKPVIPESI